MDEGETIPRGVRRAFYYATVVIGVAAFVLSSAVAADVVSGDTATKWVTFLLSLTAVPSGAFGLAYSKPKPKVD